MSTKNVLLVDADARSARVLEVSLRGAGYAVAVVGTAEQALEVATAKPPDLIVSDTKLPVLDGFAFLERVRAGIQPPPPFVFLSADSSVKARTRALELGVDDYLIKPAYVREILARIAVALQREEANRLGRLSGMSRFTGRLAEMGPVDLLQLLHQAKRSAVVSFAAGGERGCLYARAGEIVDAELGDLRAEHAVFRFLLWTDGVFDVEFREVRTEPQIRLATAALIDEGVARVARLQDLLAQIPPVDAVLDLTDRARIAGAAVLAAELGQLLMQVDGCRSIEELIDGLGASPLGGLASLARLHAIGFVCDTGRRAVRSGPADVGRWIVAAPPVVAGADTGVTAAGADLAQPSAKPTLRGIEVPQESVPRDDATDGTVPASLPENQAASADQVPGPAGGPTQTSEGDDMPKKGKRVAKKKETIPAYRAMGQPEHLANVIRFPAMAVGAGAAVAEVSAEPLASAPEPAKHAAPRESAAVPAAPQPPEPVPRREPEPTPVAAVGAIAPVAPHSYRDAAAESSHGGRRAKTDSGTSSSTIRMIAESGEHSGITKDFFQAKPEAPAEVPHHDAWEDLHPESADPHLMASNKRLKLMTGAIIVGAALVIGGYVFYNNVVMPTPEPLDGGPMPTLPPSAQGQPGIVVGTTVSVPSIAPTLAPEPAAVAPQALPGMVGETPPAQAEPSAAQEAIPLGVEPPTVGAEQAQPAVVPTPEPVAAPTPSADYATLLAQAQEHERRHRRREAEAAYRDAIAANPAGGEALASLAFMLLNGGKNQEAADFALRATVIDPTNAKAWVTLGAARQMLHDAAGARDAFRACVETGQGSFVSECRAMLR